jgi:hypothetical protein
MLSTKFDQLLGKAEMILCFFNFNKCSQQSVRFIHDRKAEELEFALLIVCVQKTLRISHRILASAFAFFKSLFRFLARIGLSV